MCMYALRLSPNKVTFFMAVMLHIFFIIDGFSLWNESHTALLKMPLKIKILYKIYFCLKVVVIFFLNNETPEPENCSLMLFLCHL